MHPDLTDPLAPTPTPDDGPALPPELQARLSEVTAECARRGALRHRALFPRVPAGWTWRGTEYVRQHDEALRVVPSVEDDAADADLFGEDSPVWEALALHGSPRPEGTRPPTVHLVILRRGAPLAERDVQRAAAFLPPGAPSMRQDGPLAGGIPDHAVAHLWAVVPSAPVTAPTPSPLGHVVDARLSLRHEPDPEARGVSAIKNFAEGEPGADPPAPDAVPVP